MTGHGVLFRAGALAAAVCLAVPVSAGAVTKVQLNFDRAKAGKVIKSPRNIGVGKTTQYVLSQDGAKVRARKSGISSGRVADFPSFDGDLEGKRAVVTIVNAGKKDALTPRSKSFSFGASVKLDATSAGTDWDDGNNLIQRGLENDAAQYKIEIDKRRPSCRVKGSKDALEVTSSTRIVTDEWYKVKCQRVHTTDGDQLVLSVWRILGDGTKVDRIQDTSGVVKIGKIRFAKSVPLSVGGKLTDKKTIERRSDQLNGRVDDVFLQVKKKS